MVESPKTIAQLAKVEQKVDDVAKDVNEVKQGQENIWSEFRRHQLTIIGKLNDQEKREIAIKNELKEYKAACDNRNAEIEKGKKKRAVIAMMGVTGFLNLAIEAAKKWL